MDTPLNGCGLPHFFVPSVVIQELEKLKVKRSYDKILLRSVEKAILFLNSSIGKHPRFHRQSCMEVKAWKQSFSENNDDKILECCLGLSDTMPKEKVILWTNDKNLVNKCLILKIDVRNWKSMMESVKSDVYVPFHFSENVMKASKKKRKKTQINNKGKKVSNKKKKTSEVSNNGSASKVAAVSENEQQIVQDPSIYKQEIHTIMYTAQQLLKDNSSILLDIEMHKTYGLTCANKQAEQEKSVLDLFDSNWNFINLLSGIVLDTCEIPHDFQYDRPKRLFTAVEVRHVIVLFYPSLEQLKNQMLEMHTAIQECKPMKIVRKLSETLLNFIPSVNSSMFEYEPFASPHFSARALELFCTNPQNRQLIEVGCKQVQKYFVKLDEALYALLRGRSEGYEA